MLLSCIPSLASGTEVNIDTITNGYAADNTFGDGILTAISSGSGLFALAVYENDELISIDFSDGEEQLSERKLNMVIENGQEKKVKVFRFDENNNPYCVNADLEYDSDNTRIYVNDDFSIKGEFKESDYHYITSDGELAIVSVPSDGDTILKPQRPRHGITAMNPGRYLVFEADYRIPNDKHFGVRLFGMYYTKANGTDGYRTIIGASRDGQIYYDIPGPGSNTYFGDKYKLSSTPTNLRLIIDLEKDGFDFYINGNQELNDEKFLGDEYYSGTKYSDKGFFIGHLSSDEDDANANGTLHIDNIKLYEGPQAIDIGNKIPNVHHTDYNEKSSEYESEYYERPTAEEIAKKVLNTPHPRLMITAKEVDEIKYSTDENIIKWKQAVMEKAEAALNTPTYKYQMEDTSIGDLPESRQLMMNLGMAYLLTGDRRYPERAYEEAKVMFGIYTPIDGDKNNTAESNKDYWNSHSCHNVTEISQILSVCFDWMYDAWTPEQRAEITKHVMEKGIDNMYRTYYKMYLPSHSYQSWWDVTNNQGGVANGSAIVTAIAFMEEDAHRCSQIAESGIRSLEIVLKNFYPDGGWMESASYWRYTMEFVTMAACTLDRVCGTNYGLQNTPGLKKGCFYSLAIEGETGAMSLGDGSSSATNVPFLFYWASAFKDEEIGAAAMYAQKKHEAGIYDLIYYDADYVDDSITLPETYYYSGTEMVSLRSGSGIGETYMVMAGGLGHSTGHDHLDSGHIILEMNGERVFKDMGAEHYSAKGYFGTNRHLYFRARPEAHNIFIINPYNVKTVDADGKEVDYYGQDKNAVSRIIDEPNENKKSATIDLSDAYARDAKEATRTISIADDKKAIIEDTIVLKDDGDIFWNWYVALKQEDEKGKPQDVGEIKILQGGKYAEVTKNNKKFKVTFETNSKYSLSEETLPEKGGYYVDVLPETDKLHKDNNYSGRIVVNIKGRAGETVKIKTIVESID